MKRHGKHVQHCGRCHRMGHNARTCSRRNPWVVDMLLKPALAAASAHAATEVTKAGIGRAKKAAKRRR